MTRDGVVLAEAAEATRGSHVTGLPALVERTVAGAGLAMADVQAVAVSIGPGSFTGLRVGLAFAKGLVFAGGLPLVAVPTLEALAFVAEAPPGTTVCAALDARKREVYAALFRVDAGGRPVRLTPDRALAPEALARELRPGCVLVGDGAEAYADALAAAGDVRPFATHPPRGGVVARLGEERLRAGDAADPGTLEPAYVRPPEVELPRPGSR